MPDHPPYNEMVVTAITDLNERGGSSRQAIAKYITDNYTVSPTYETYMKQSLKRLVKKRVLSQPKGTGASGSFTISKTLTATRKNSSRATTRASVPDEQDLEQDSTDVPDVRKRSGKKKKTTSADENAGSSDEGSVWEGDGATKKRPKGVKIDVKIDVKKTGKSTGKK